MLRLDPSADVWLLQREGVLARRASGLTFFPGPVAELCASRLAGGGVAIETFFAGVVGHASPIALQRVTREMREDGLIVEDDGRPRRGPLSLADLEAAGLCGCPEPVMLDGFAALPALRTGAPWAPVVRSVETLAVGPLLGSAARAPCPSCLRSRASEHDDLGKLLAARPNARRAGAAEFEPATTAKQAAWVVRSLRSLAALPAGTILLHAAGGDVQARALPRGGCPDCLTPPLPHPVPGDAAAPLRAAGYRPLTAAAFLAQVVPQAVDPVSGIVRGLAYPRASRFAHVVIARHAFPRAAPDPRATIANRQGRSAGKGRTRADAEAGAVAEALERYAGICRPGDICRTGVPAELDGPSIDPRSWTLYSDRQLAEARAWRAIGADAAWTPDAVDPRAPIGWTAVRDAVTGEPGWAPGALCWHQVLEPASDAAAPGRADSNGCAAGQTLADAKLQALLELVERDAVGIWWWNRVSRPELDPASFDDPWLLAAIHEIASLGYRVGLRDLTHDLGVPVVAAVAWPDGARRPALVGFGAHPAARTAAARAVTELAQALPIGDAADEDPRARFALVPGSRLDEATAEEDLDFLIPSGRAEATLDALPAAATATEALDGLMGTLGSLGLRAWVLDQSRPDVPVPVVRMIVPGLRHFRPRFAPGRLETVTQAPGWEPHPRGRNRLLIPL